MLSCLYRKLTESALSLNGGTKVSKFFQPAAPVCNFHTVIVLLSEKSLIFADT